MCNLLVFVTFLYRYGRSASPPLSTKSDEDDDYTTPFRPRQTSLNLTIIEVGGADYSGDETPTWSNGCTNDAASGVSDILSPSEEQSQIESS
ncbi:hypothetical protein BKA83DRAFT_363684 [Pisolithus microcarpus]|nr:hypothetical protein BKA83DRAFT_363684 [Pisolithus microcarpus]